MIENYRSFNEREKKKIEINLLLNISKINQFCDQMIFETLNV